MFRTVIRFARSLSLAAVGVLFFAAGLPAATNPDWFSRPWQTDDGLPNNNVPAIAQTTNGFLWLGTPSGLVSFDGAQFQKFNLTNAAFAGNRGVTLMVGSRSGGLWLAMDRGAIIYLDGERTKVFTAENGLADTQVRGMAEAGDGTLWILFNGGSRLIKNGKVMALPEMGNLPAGQFTTLACDANGDIWWVKGSELGIYRDGKFQRLVRISNGSAGLAAAKGGGVWVCTGAHLFHCDATGRMDDRGSFDSNRTAGNSTALIEDSEGAVWIGTAFGGLIRYDGSTFENISTSRPEIQSLLEDREGNIWAGTLGGGLNRIRRRVVQLQGVETGLPFESVLSLCEDTKGTLWAVTENGQLARHIGDRWQVVSAGTNWAGYDLTCVTPDADGGLWIGAHGRKLLHWQEGRDVELVQSNRLVGTIFSLIANTNGDVWMGQVGRVNGLQCLQDGKLIDEKLPADVRTIRAAARDTEGNIWFGSARGDLLKVRDGKVTIQNLPETDVALSIRCLTAMPDGSLWIGYDGMGVGWIDKNGRYNHVRAAQGLFDDYISQIISDNNGWLWFGSDHGIFKAREKDIIAVAEGKIQRLDSIHYSQGEGAANLQANFGYSPGGLCSRDGRIWIPTRAGLVVINPNLLPKKSKPAAVLLTRVIADDQTIAQYKTVADSEPGGATLDLRAARPVLQLPPDYQRLEIDFTTLNFSDPGNIRFRYRLVGLDSGWRETGPEDRFATYSRLPAGNYLFEVKARNSDGVWGENGPTLSFTVLPYFWQTWWFRLATLAVFIAAPTGAVRYISFRRLRLKLHALEQQAALEKERTRIARDLHDDLGGSLTEVTLLLERALREQTDVRVRQGLATTRQAIKSLDETVWAVNPSHDKLPELISYLGQFAADFLQAAGIPYQMDLPDHPPERPVSAETRHNLFLVVKEALSNIARHATARTVRINISVADDFLRVDIEDDGRGFEHVPDNVHADGLPNMRQRMEEIGGRFQIESKPSCGTKIRFLCPWPPGE